MPQQNRTASQRNQPSSERSQPSYQQRAMDSVEDAYHSTESMVRDNPASSALITFGVGVGLGLLLTSLLSSAKPRRSNWYDSYIPDNLSRTVSDAVSKMLPEMLARRL